MVQLEGHTLYCATPIASAEDWQSVAIWPQHHHDPHAITTSGLLSLGQCPLPPEVFAVSGAGSTIAGCTLQLHNSACIVFDATCKDVELVDVVVKGVRPNIHSACV